MMETALYWITSTIHLGITIAPWVLIPVVVYMMVREHKDRKEWNRKMDALGSTEPGGAS